jgi:hypothetical protein
MNSNQRTALEIHMSFYRARTQTWLLVSLFIVLSGLPVSAQALCPLQETLNQAIPQQCLASSDQQSLAEYLANPRPNEDSRRRALNIVSAAYRCGLEKPAAQASSCSQGGLAEHFYSRFKEDRELCLADRLTRASANLRYVLDLKIPPFRRLPETEVDRIYGALSDAQFAVRISKEVKQRPTIKRRTSWLFATPGTGASIP